MIAKTKVPQGRLQVSSSRLALGFAPVINSVVLESL